LPGAEGLTLPGLPNAPGLSALQVVAKPDFAALGSTFKNFGKAFDTSDVKNMFSPAGFFKNLQKQGLDNVGGISDQMIDMGMDPNVPEAANPDDLKAILATVVGTDLQKIITQTGIVLPPTASVNSAADLLDAKKILPSDILSKLPGGSLAGLGNSLLNMGGTFKSPADLGKMLSSVKTIELPHMDALSSPLPDDIKSAFAPMLGKGGGPFGNPTVNDIVGTAAGHAHTDAIGGVVTSQASILASPAGQALKAAVDALAADPTSSVKMATFLAAQSAVTNSTNADLAKVVKSSEDAITATEDQLDTETSNLSVAGITPTAAVTPPPTQLLGTASKLHDMGVDKQELGYNDMLTNMSDDDLYGDAIKATLSEGKNIAASAAAGIPNTTKIDPQAVLAQVKGQV
jgi:hypothetical protein